MVDEHHLTRTYKFKDFAGPLAFVNKVGAIAEEQDHHPDIDLSWGKVKIELWTHKVDGLSGTISSSPPRSIRFPPADRRLPHRPRLS